MPSGLSSWLDHLVLKSASELEIEGKTRFRFSEAVRAGLEDKPIQPWELDRWARGLKCGLLRLEGYFFRAGAGKKSSLSFFVRNDQGLLVGFRRESITQAATFVSLITDYGYGRDSTRFETGWMDVAVFDPRGDALIYAENKASTSTLKKLCRRLEGEFLSGVPFVDGEERPHDDVLMKAQHIWRHRPRYFWGVAPDSRSAYRVVFGKDGFFLTEIPVIPDALEWDSGVD